VKEKHLHAKYHALFQLCFTKCSQKKVYISNVIIFKNEKVFSKMIFLKQVKKNIPNGVSSTKCPVAT
jgi:hypothetical protein